MRRGECLRLTAVVVGVLIPALLVPAAATPAPTGTDRANAARECRAERAEMGVENFRQKYGTNPNRRNAFGNCLSRRARAQESERKAAVRAAIEECRAERADPNFSATHEGKTFAEFYGRGPRGRHAFANCVRTKVAANRAATRERRQRFLQAVRMCREEQRANPAAFRAKYGTDRNQRNAFRNCVSQRFKELNDKD